MTIFSQFELDFFDRHGIPHHKVFDAAGMRPKEYMPLMSELGFWVAVNTKPCRTSAHVIRTRSGHCAICSPHAIAFLRRFDEAGYVYVASSTTSPLIKVGTGGDPERREISLNTFGYGGVTDWHIRFSEFCSRAGRIELLAHQALAKRKVSRSYEKQGVTINCSELFVCSSTEAIKAVRKAIKVVGGGSDAT